MTFVTSAKRAARTLLASPSLRPLRRPLIGALRSKIALRRTVEGLSGELQAARDRIDRAQESSSEHAIGLASEIVAWQDRCRIAETELDDTRSALSLDLAAWQQRCSLAENGRAERASSLSRDLLVWQERCSRAESRVQAQAGELASWPDRLGRLQADLTARQEQCDRAEFTLRSQSAELSTWPDRLERADRELFASEERCRHAEAEAASKTGLVLTTETARAAAKAALEETKVELADSRSRSEQTDIANREIVEHLDAELESKTALALISEAARATAQAGLEQVEMELADLRSRSERTDVDNRETVERLCGDIGQWQDRYTQAQASLGQSEARLAEVREHNRERQAEAERAGQDLTRLRLLVEHTLLHQLPDVSTPDSPSAAVFLRFARLFAPAAAVDILKIRVGDRADGGYVMLDDLSLVTHALSLGVGDNVSWDAQVADGGAVVHQYDHTVDGPPISHDGFRFHRQKVVPRAEDGAVTLHEAMVRLLSEGAVDRVALKIDIEAAEWDIIDEASPADLARCSQIVCEFHWFGMLRDTRALAKAERVVRKLNEAFQVVHVHANNYAPYVIIGGVPFPSVLEVTYANRADYRFEPTDEVFPTALDVPNCPTLPDQWLGRFSFS